MKLAIGKSADGVLSIDLAKLIDTRALIQANSGGGKSWLLRLLAEKTIGHVQTIILDPEGEFATLREKHEILLVGREGEVQTDPRGAGLLARKLVELQVSAVIDLYDLPIPERRRYMRLFLGASMKSSSFSGAFRALRDLELIEGEKEFTLTASLAGGEGG